MERHPASPAAAAPPRAGRQPRRASQVQASATTTRVLRDPEGQKGDSMSSQTTTLTPSQRRDEAIAAYQAALTAVEDARARNDKAAVLKAAGRMGTPVERIRDAELDMAMDGVEFTPWVKPTTARPSKLQDIGTAADVQAQLDKLRTLGKANAKDRPTVAASCESRVSALLKAAAKRGLKVS